MYHHNFAGAHCCSVPTCLIKQVPLSALAWVEFPAGAKNSGDVVVFRNPADLFQARGTHGASMCQPRAQQQAEVEDFSLATETVGITSLR